MKALTVGIDTSPLTSGHSGRGIGFYTLNLLNHLKKLSDLKLIEIPSGQIPAGLDLIHYPYFDLFYHTLHPNKGIPVVVTVHDVTPLLFPQHYPPGIQGRFHHFQQKQALRQVKEVITVSQASKNDMVKHLDYPEDKITVVPEAPADYFTIINDNVTLEKVKAKFNLPSEFLLFAGNVNWNKNIVNLVQAAVDAHKDIVLVGKSFTQRENLTHPEMRSFKQFLDRFSNHPLVHILGYVEVSELVALYNLASIFLFPSYYEGFGLPVLEAQKCGTPVITSSNSSLVEVAGDAAILVNPEQVTEITAAITRLSSDSQLKKDLVAKGLLNAQKYSWDTTAQLTRKVYEKLAI